MIIMNEKRPMFILKVNLQKKEKVWGIIAFDKVMKDVANELDKYRQVSFCRDYGKNMPGYASPMMWGQYARSKDENGKWQDGVCIELESDMFMRPDNVFYEHRINYPQKVKAPYLHKINFTKEYGKNTRDQDGVFKKNLGKEIIIKRQIKWKITI